MVKKMPKYLVEAISTFRLRYVIDSENAQGANDQFSANQHDLIEFSQLHQGETITSTREIDDAEYLRLFDEDNDYLKDWPEKDKFDFVNTVENTN